MDALRFTIVLVWSCVWTGLARRVQLSLSSFVSRAKLFPTTSRSFSLGLCIFCRNPESQPHTFLFHHTRSGVFVNSLGPCVSLGSEKTRNRLEHVGSLRSFNDCSKTSWISFRISPFYRHGTFGIVCLPHGFQRSYKESIDSLGEFIG